jgi:hypothetical protein
VLPHKQQGGVHALWMLVMLLLGCSLIRIDCQPRQCLGCRIESCGACVRWLEVSTAVAAVAAAEHVHYGEENSVLCMALQCLGRLCGM